MFVVRDIAALRKSRLAHHGLGSRSLTTSTSLQKRVLPTSRSVNDHNINISLSLNAARHAARLTSLVEGIWLQA
jgi:hypothetical protein